MRAATTLPFSSNALRLAGSYPSPLPRRLQPTARSSTLETLVATYTTSPSRHQSDSSPSPPARNPKWLSQQKARLGQCIMFGLSGAQIGEAGRIARILAEEWQGLVAGPEGFCIGAERAGEAWEEKVLWGSMVGFPLSSAAGHCR